MNRTLTTAVLSAALALAGTALPAPAEAGPLFSAARGALAKRALRTAPQRLVKPAPVKPTPGKPVDTFVHRSRHPETAAHVDRAQRKGQQPTIVQIDRNGTKTRRAQALSSVDRTRKPGPGYDRDEYPPSFTRPLSGERVNKNSGHNSSVTWVKSSDNRGAGSSLGHQTRHLPDGTKIRINVVD